MLLKHKSELLVLIVNNDVTRGQYTSIFTPKMLKSQHWTMRLSYFTPLRSAWNFQLPFPPQGETFLQGGRGVRPIASRRLLCAILSAYQMQNQKQSRLGHPRFPAFRLIGRFALSSHWLFRVFPFLLIVITLVSVLGHSIEKRSGS